jgi:hypothetical protein
MDLIPFTHPNPPTQLLRQDSADYNSVFVSQLPSRSDKPNHRPFISWRIPTGLVVLDRVQCRIECALVADPQRTGWSKGNAPSVHKVHV